MSMPQKLPPIHPGEILLEEFMRPLDLSSTRLARDLDIPEDHLCEIINGRRGITADMALRLAEYFGTSPRMWLNLQTEHDLRQAERQQGEHIRARVRRLHAS